MKNSIFNTQIHLFIVNQYGETGRRAPTCMNKEKDEMNQQKTCKTNEEIKMQKKQRTLTNANNEYDD